MTLIGCRLVEVEIGLGVAVAVAARWETGYWGSMDIMHDRAGYYICWGCLVLLRPPPACDPSPMRTLAHASHVRGRRRHHLLEMQAPSLA